MQLIDCQCGCGEKIRSHWNSHTQRFTTFKHGHNMKGNIPSEETRKKIGQAQLAENNHHWFGNKTKYQGVHKWVRSRLKKPELCQRCAINPPKQMHNISGKYRRDLDDWLYVCVKCHAEIDGRVRRLKQYGLCESTAEWGVLESASTRRN